MKDDLLVIYINRFFHDLTANYYNKQHPEIFILEKKRIKSIFEKFLKNKKYDRIIDIGSGTGFVYENIRNLIEYKKFYMLDLSYNMLSITKAHHPECIYINSSAIKLPFKNETFDLVILNSTLHHLPNIEIFLKEAHRVLKKQGKLLINHEPNQNFSKNSFLWIQAMFLMNLIKLLYPIKTLKSIIAKLRKIKNPIYDEINRKLIEIGLIDKPLKYEQISAYIDYFSPTAGYLRRNKGINPNIFKNNDYFKIIYFETYDYLGKFSEKFPNPITKLYENFLKKLYPMDGSKFSILLEKL